MILIRLVAGVIFFCAVVYVSIAVMGFWGLMLWLFFMGIMTLLGGNSK
ncbi:hypothetical protein [Lampropedia puyangensis]|nr:hypothetical protein [Lampropedia puyangensis]